MGVTMFFPLFRFLRSGSVSMGALAVSCVLMLSPVQAQDDDAAYAYYEVTGVSALNIRERPYMNSEVLAVAEEGEVLIKWKRFCSLRPWCPVQKGDVQGWAGKAYLTETEPE